MYPGGLDSRDLLMKGIGILRGTPLDSQTTRAPNHQATISWQVPLQQNTF